MKSNIEKNLLKVATGAVKQSVLNSEMTRWGWPPACLGIFHQPKRPDSMRMESEDKTNK